jgi:hypothetical protein
MCAARWYHLHPVHPHTWIPILDPLIVDDFGLVAATTPRKRKNHATIFVEPRGDDEEDGLGFLCGSASTLQRGLQDKL